MEIQSLEKEDLGSLVEVQPKDWPDIIPFFEFYVNSSFCFGLKMVCDQKTIGVGVSIIQNDVAWLAHIIVHGKHRNKGIGKEIARSLVDFSFKKSCQTIYLIATDLGAFVYEKIGFVTETDYLFYENLTIDLPKEESKYLRTYNAGDQNELIQLDKLVSSEERAVHFKGKLSDAIIYSRNNILEGYYLPSLGDGVIVANTSRAGMELMKLRIKNNTEAVFPENNTTAINFLTLHGYNHSKRAKRMRLGKKKPVLLDKIYNRIGGNIG